MPALRFILASASPRRRELLEKAGFEFDLVSPEVAETSSASLTIRERTTCNATRKALAVAKNSRDAVVLGADTLVAVDGEVIGKPFDLGEAAKFLRRLSGRSHEVWTAVFICHRANQRAQAFCEISRVHFRELTEQAIADYFTKVNPLDKAGAYAAQGHGTEIIERIEGSFSNVVGLPMEATTRALRAFGIAPRPRS